MTVAKKRRRPSKRKPPGLTAEDLQDLRRRLETYDVGPELASRLTAGPPDWFSALCGELTLDREAAVLGHPEEARLDRLTSSPKTAIGKRYRELRRLADEFTNAVPKKLRGTWLDLDRALGNWTRLECAIYYNAGVERGIELATTKKALKAAGVQVEQIDSDALFVLSSALSDIARHLPLTQSRTRAPRGVK